MAIDNCKEVEIPETDNTPLDCDKFILDQCVEIPIGDPFLLTNDNDNLSEFHEKLIEKLVAMNQRLVIVEGETAGTTTYELSLTGTTLTLSVNGNSVATVDLASLASGGVAERKERFIAVGGETSLTLLDIVNTSYPVQVTIEGITMLEGIGDDYTISGNTINLALTAPLVAGNIIQVYYKY